MSPGGASVEGVVLCMAAGHRLAVLAREVTTVALPDDTAPWAGRGFVPDAPRPESGRLLLHAQQALLVDSLEVHAEGLPLLPVPPLLAGIGLRGFVEAAGHLWPVISLSALAARLGGGA